MSEDLKPSGDITTALIKNNKKIKIIGTYHKNKIRESRKNLITKKLNIENDLKIVYDIELFIYEPSNILIN